MYKIGDRVKIRKDLEDFKKYGSDSVVPPMSEYCGQEATITNLISHGYEIDIDNNKWGWTDEMFEGLVKGE